VGEVGPFQQKYTQYMQCTLHVGQKADYLSVAKRHDMRSTNFAEEFIFPVQRPQTEQSCFRLLLYKCLLHLNPFHHVIFLLPRGSVYPARDEISHHLYPPYTS
jgi:hypothetical protein